MSGKCYLHYLSLHGRVGVLWTTPVGPTHVVRWVPPPAIGTALLGLTFWDVLCSFVLFPTLTVLVVLLVVAWRTPATWISSVMVTICCIFTALHWNSTRACDIGCLRTLKSGNSNRGNSHHPTSYSTTLQCWATIYIHIVKKWKTIHLLGCHQASTQTTGTTPKPAVGVFQCALTPESCVYLFSLNHIKLHGLSISYAAEVLPGVILLYGSLTTQQCRHSIRIQRNTFFKDY